MRRCGAAYSGEILDEFTISEQTLRRRRPQLKRLGVRFVPNGRGSLYVADESLAHHLPTKTDYTTPARVIRAPSAHPERARDPDSVRTP